MRNDKLDIGATTVEISTVLLIAVACSAAGASSNGATSSSSSSSSGGSSTSNSTGSQPGFVITDASTQGGAANSSDSGQAVPCTDGGDCVCPTLSVAVIGTPGIWDFNSGANSNTAFQDWLNSSSAGTAKVDNFTTKPTLTADFLAGYNVIILTGLGDDSNKGPWWTFDSNEVAAFQDWITNDGGGVITLSGFSSDSGEITAKNALLAFSGISYKDDGPTPPCALVDANNNEMCYCTVGSLGTISEWNRTDPVIENLALGVTLIGMSGGRSIVAPPDAHVAATGTYNSTSSNDLVGKIAGKGRVLVYSDEWTTYTTLWSGAGIPGTTIAACQDYLPQNRFQTAQLWYNMIRWTQPNATCFKIVNRQQPVTVW